jgi:predicted O-methyltransferase YrrM
LDDEHGTLSAREEAFCREYVRDIKRNGTQAVISAGLTENRESAAVMAARMLRNVSVKARIRELEREALEAAGVKSREMAAAVMREYMRIAFSDITDVVHISPSSEDPGRGAALEELARLNGGQHVIDFGETIAVPTTNLSSDVTAAIKNISVKRSAKTGLFEGMDVSMHDKLNALRVLAEASGLVKNAVALDAGAGGPLVIRWAGEKGGKSDGDGTG